MTLSLAMPLSNSSLVSPCGFTTTYEAMSKWNIGRTEKDITAKSMILVPINVTKSILECVEVGRRCGDKYYQLYPDRHHVHIKDCNADNTCTKLSQAVFMNNFENLDNVYSHYSTTSPETYNQYGCMWEWGIQLL